MNRPEKTFKMGAVRASVFLNSFTSRDGRAVPLRKVVLEVRYKDRNGQWQGTKSLSLNDLPKAVSALQQAYEYLLSENGRLPHDEQDASDSPLPPPSASSAPAASAKPLGTKHF